MTDECTVFWRSNERAYELFQELLARAEKSSYDDEFLTLLATYREVQGTPVHADIFAAQDLPGGAQCLNVDRCSIIERGFWVDLDADGLCTVRGFGFELGNVVGVGGKVSGVVAYPSSGGGCRVHGCVNGEH